MKLNVGCGDDIRQGYVNIDFRQTHPAVMKVDLSVLPWPFVSNNVEEILMLDFLEHFSYAQTQSLLKECSRLLKVGGELVVQVPDFQQLARAVSWIGRFWCNSCGHEVNTLSERKCASCGRRREIQDAAVGRLYGGQNYPGNYHQTAFTEELLILKAEDERLELLQMEQRQHQEANWNFCARFRRRA